MLFNRAQEKIEEVISKNNLTDIISIYSYGSIAQGNLESRYSNFDLWFVVKEMGIKERVNFVKDATYLFETELFLLLDNYHNIDTSSTGIRNTLWFFTEDEFLANVKVYPTVILYQIINNDWKLIYGKQLHSAMKMPPKKKCIELLQFDFEMHVNHMNLFAAEYDVRRMVKMFLRALKYAIWIIEDEFLSDKDKVLQNAEKLFPEDLLLKSVFSRIRVIMKNDYIIGNRELFTLWQECSKITGKFGQMIRIHVEREQYPLLEQFQYTTGAPWGNFAREFAKALRWYISLEKEDKLYIIDQLKIHHLQTIRYLQDIILNGLDINDVYFTKDNSPVKISSIIFSDKINKVNYSSVLESEQFLFLIDSCKTFIYSKEIYSLDVESIKAYLLDDYLTAMNQVFKMILSSNIGFIEKKTTA